MESILAQLATEQPSPTYDNLDKSSTVDILKMLNEADRTVPAAVAEALPQITLAVDAIVQRLQQGGRLVYVGAGTSGRLGIIDAAECPPTFNTPRSTVVALIAGGTGAVFEAVEEAEDQLQNGASDLARIHLRAADAVVGITASGRTPYVVGALDYAGQVGAQTISISCNRGSVVSRHAQVPIEVETGPEVLMGSTRLKAGTAQKLVLNMLSTGAMIRFGKAYRNLMVDLQATNEKLVERSKRIIMLATDITYDEAAATLDASDGDVKTAIVMVRKGVDKASAQRVLHAADGHLRRALGEA